MSAPWIAASLLAACVATNAAMAAAPALSAEDVARLERDACVWRFETRLPAAGEAWVERWRPEACARRAPANLQLVERDAGALAVTRLLPGTGRQPLAVQREATLAVLARAASADCRERRVVDTRVIAEDANRVVERWTVEACGRERAFQLTFTVPDGGLAAITVAPAAAALSR